MMHVHTSLVFSEGFLTAWSYTKTGILNAFYSPAVRPGSIYPALPCLDDHDGTSQQNVLKSQQNSPYIRPSGMQQEANASHRLFLHYFWDPIICRYQVFLGLGSCPIECKSNFVQRGVTSSMDPFTVLHSRVSGSSRRRYILINFATGMGFLQEVPDLVGVISYYVYRPSHRMSSCPT